MAFEVLLLDREPGRWRPRLDEDPGHYLRSLDRARVCQDQHARRKLHGIAGPRQRGLCGLQVSRPDLQARRAQLFELRASSSSIRRPLCMIPMRVASRSTSVRMWLDMKTVTPRVRANDLSSSRISTTPAGSSPLAGSSRIRSSGSCSNARARARRCRLPDESWPAFRPAYGPSPSLSMTRRSSRRRPPLDAAGVRSPGSPGQTTRDRRRGIPPGAPPGSKARARSGRPAAPELDRSALGWIMPKSSRMVVVLPAPFRPRKP